MIDIKDVKLRDRISKAIFNIRLIASRVKRSQLQDAMQRLETVVTSLDAIRKYVLAVTFNPTIAGIDTAFKHNIDTMAGTLNALQEADTIYKMLPKTKEKSYREEIKQVKILFKDVIEYLDSILAKGDVNATIKE